MFDFNMIADEPFEKHPIILSELEWRKLTRMKGQEDCKHEWVEREKRPEDLLIVFDDHIERTDMPFGRYCSKCHRVELGAASAAEDRPVWTQLDMIELGLE